MNVKKINNKINNQIEVIEKSETERGGGENYYTFQLVNGEHNR